VKPYFTHFPIPNLELPHISPIMGGKQQCSAGYTYGPVMRQYYILEYILSGCGEYTANGHIYKVNAGECFIIKPYEAHILRADKTNPWEYVWVGFRCDLKLPELLEENYVFDASSVADIFEKLADGNHKSRSTADYAADVYGIFARLYAMHSKKEKDAKSPVERAISIIQNEYATITVQSLSNRLFMNRSYFGATFKKKTGKTPKEYIDEKRLSVAAMMMEEFGYTATQAALATGYSDVMCFSKMYKKHFGKSPRNSVKKKSPRGETIILK